MLYRFTSNQLYSCGFAGVALGIARGTINDFLDLPANKISRGASRPMRENNVVQSQLAQCEARWRSARAFLHTTLGDAWQHVEQTGEQTAEQRCMIRLASTWAIQQSREMVTRCIMRPARSRCSRKIRSSGGCATSIRWRSSRKDGSCTSKSVGQIMFGMEPENQF